MLTRTDTEEFAIYTHAPTTYEATDEAARLKWIRERNQLARWFHTVLADREIIVTWQEGAEQYSITATLKTQGYNNVTPLPPVEPHWDQINGSLVAGTSHVVFYARPEMVPVRLELAAMTNMIVRRQGLDDLLKVS
jgi:rhodanese-related sulfurtransferase